MNNIQFILYNLPEEDGKVQVVIKDETIWATQKAMSQLFGVGVPAINKHLKNIFNEKELDVEVVVSKMEITTQHGAIEGKQQHVETSFYSLDAIIAVGYRVSSARATKFRIWATKILNEFIRKGFVLDDEHFRNYKILEGKGKISKVEADAKAESEYNIFNKTQPIFSDFDKETLIPQHYNLTLFISS